MIALKKIKAFDEEFSVFASEIRACEHICDHLLSRPEGFDWSVLRPELKPLLISKSGFELARRMWRSGDEALPESQELYDFYAKAINDSLRAANMLGWHGSDYPNDGDPADRWALGLDGVYVVLSLKGKVVKTAYIPNLKHDEDNNRVNDSEIRTNSAGMDAKSGGKSEVLAKRSQNPLPRDKNIPDDPEDFLPPEIRAQKNLAKAINSVSRHLFERYVNWAEAFRNEPKDVDEWKKLKSCLGL